MAPALAMTYLLVTRTIAFEDTAEAFGWLGTGVLVGAALGAAGAGIAVDVVGVGGAFGFAAVTAIVGAVTAACSVPTLSRELGT